MGSAKLRAHLPNQVIYLSLTYHEMRTSDAAVSHLSA